MTGGPTNTLLHLDCDLTISIVTWNSRADILPCLDSIRAAVGSLTWSAVVFDNDSPDGTGEFVREHGPQAKVLQSRENVGFGVGHNTAMRLGVGRAHLILNPDTRLMPGALEALYRFLAWRSDVGFVGPKVLEKDGAVYPSFRSFPTPGALLFRNKLMSALFPRNPYTRHYLLGDRDRNETQPAGWLSGSAIMVSREALEDVGLLDERFFMYCEDMDWCRRAHDRGWEVYYHPAASIVHLRSRSTDQRIPAMILEHHRSMWKYYRKHGSAGKPLVWSAGVAAALAVRAYGLVALFYLRKSRAAR